MTLDTKRLRELAEAATPGPWYYGHLSEVDPSVEIVGSNGVSVGEIELPWDQQFIAASRTALPQLLDRVEELELEADLKQMSIALEAHYANKFESQLTLAIAALQSLATYQFDINDNTGALVKHHCREALRELMELKGTHSASEDSPSNSAVERAKRAFNFQQEMQKANQKLEELGVRAKIKNPTGGNGEGKDE